MALESFRVRVCVVCVCVCSFVCGYGLRAEWRGWVLLDVMTQAQTSSANTLPAKCLFFRCIFLCRLSISMCMCVYVFIVRASCPLPNGRQLCAFCAFRAHHVWQVGRSTRAPRTELFIGLLNSFKRIFERHLESTVRTAYANGLLSAQVCNFGNERIGTFGPNDNACNVRHTRATNWSHDRSVVRN